MKDGAMMELLQPVTELLNNQYAAVGIMEEWKASIRLFQAALDLPKFDWEKVGGLLQRCRSVQAPFRLRSVYYSW